MQKNAAKKSAQGISDINLDVNKPVIRAGSAISDVKRRKSSSAFRTISEVADELGVKQHVLRFWETKFSQVKPLKRGGGRRYYRPEDVGLLQAIHRLLHVEGYTIKGVQKLLREAGKKQVVTAFSSSNVRAEYKRKPLTGDRDVDRDMDFDKNFVPVDDSSCGLTKEQKENLKSVLDELKELRGMIKPR